MRWVEKRSDLREALRDLRARYARIGFVPTMGALHAGHLSLVQHSQGLADACVASVFVNPLQFGPSEDLARYPRDVDGDRRRLADSGAALVFAPDAEEMYGARRDTSVECRELAALWEGAVRPGHFAGVLTVVAKLFNLVQPDVAVFGRKDYQQATVIRAMVRDLNFPVDIAVAPTVRDSDGLALSSRNAYLTADERRRAHAMPASLAAVAAAFRNGERDANRLAARGRDILTASFDTVEYFAIVHPETLQPLELADEGAMLLAAGRLPSTRLIDNVRLGADPGLEGLPEYPAVSGDA